MSAPLGELDSDDPRVRARTAAALGQKGRWPNGASAALTELAAGDPSSTVRRAALATLVRRARPTRAQQAWLRAARDDDAAIRKAAADTAPTLAPRVPATNEIAATLVALLDDRAPLVAEASAFALGEIAADGAVTALMRHARNHSDPLVREACVAALGSLAAAGRGDGDDVLGVLLTATEDKPAIRRRAVIALSAFDGPEVDAALERALSDRDWQVRQLAEDLSSQ